MDMDEAERKEVLDKMVARATVKPDEDPHKLNKLGLTKSEAAPELFDGRNPDGSARGTFKISEITGQPKRVYPDIEPDYDSDSSTEDAPNRIGNVPLEWYDDLPHIGYDINGRKIMRPAKGDALDRFLATVEDPDSWTTAEDKLMGKDVKLTDEELDIIRRLQNAEIPDASYDPYEPMTEWFTGPGKEMIMPLTSRPEPKSRFVPSKWEHKKVMKIVRAIRQGRITPSAPATTKPQYYNIWSDADQPAPDHPMNMPAPKMPLPSHAESYNPPAEYLFNKEEEQEWKEADAEDRRQNFLPAKFDALRKVPAYKNFLTERFERCLDLYLAPRMRRQRLEINDPDSLLPKLPSPKELRPFPTNSSITFEHPNKLRVRSVAFDPRGQWLATGADDGRVRLWDVAIGRCVMVWDLHAGSPNAERAPVYNVEWCPSRSLSLFAACTAGKIMVVVPPHSNGLGSSIRGANSSSASMQFATEGYQPPGSESSDKAKAPAKWSRPSEADRRLGIAALVSVKGTPKQVTWHSKGDYFATVASDASSSAVLIHQLSKQRTQSPFTRASRGSAVQKVAFHPTRPHLFVATQRLVRVYDLAGQKLMRTLQPGLKWISSLSVHPMGDHLVVGSYDRRLAWFDLELSTRPYKILRYHSRALRAVAFHATLPLLTSVSDDGAAHVLHATVYNDLSTNPLIVPLKVLRGHQVKEGLGILDAKWHPSLPWLVTAGADGDARLWTT